MALLVSYSSVCIVLIIDKALFERFIYFISGTLFQSSRNMNILEYTKLTRLRVFLKQYNILVL